MRNQELKEKAETRETSRPEPEWSGPEGEYERQYPCKPPVAGVEDAGLVAPFGEIGKSQLTRSSRNLPSLDQYWCGGHSRFDGGRKIAYCHAMSDLHIALYQPDIPGNTGTILRLAACLGVKVHIIEPAGFDISDRNLKRAGMDYLSSVALARHVNWQAFEEWRQPTGQRLVLASTKAALPYVDWTFRPDDVLLFGRESAGVPDHVHDAADARILIPMVEGQRSVNVAMSAAMIAGEALRQTSWS